MNWADAVATLGSLLGEAGGMGLAGGHGAGTSTSPTLIGGFAKAPLSVAYWAENLRGLLQGGEGYLFLSLWSYVVRGFQFFPKVTLFVSFARPTAP